MKINQMPSKALLEEYLDGGHGSRPVTVIFNIEKGIFEKTQHHNPQLQRPAVTEDN